MRLTNQGKLGAGALLLLTGATLYLTKPKEDSSSTKRSDVPSLQHYQSTKIKRQNSTTKDPTKLQASLSDKIDEVLKKWPERNPKNKDAMTESALRDLLLQVKVLFSDGYLDPKFLELSSDEIIKDLNEGPYVAKIPGAARDLILRAIDLKQFNIMHYEELRAGLSQNNDAETRYKPLKDLLKSPVASILREIPTAGYGSPSFLQNLVASMSSEEYKSLPEDLKICLSNLRNKITEDGEKFKAEYAQLSELDPTMFSESDYKQAIKSVNEFNQYKQWLLQAGLTDEADISVYINAEPEEKKRYLEGARNASYLKSKLSNALGKEFSDPSNLFELLHEINTRSDKENLLHKFTPEERGYLETYSSMIQK